MGQSVLDSFIYSSMLALSVAFADTVVRTPWIAKRMRDQDIIDKEPNPGAVETGRFVLLLFVVAAIVFGAGFLLYLLLTAF